MRASQITSVTPAFSSTASARFDDMSLGTGIAFAGRGFLREIVASTIDEVVPALADVEREAANGRWAAGFMAYDAAPGLDRGLVVPGCREAGGLPLVWFGVFEGRHEVDAVSPVQPGQSLSWHLSRSAAEHSSGIAAVKAHIEAGDTYQVNLTARLRSTGVDPAALYRQLVHAQRPAYGALIDTGRHVVVSASPELFFDWADGLLTCRPMKGTAPRGRWSAEDVLAGTALAGAPKDLAENVMIVDLIRNDLGRVCEYGSVTVDRLFEVEPYPTVWQLTSQVVGRVRAGVGLVEIVRSVFPCGSITGAPKQRTMELIADLEPEPRGVYCGAIGWVGPGETGGVRARWSVAIRTAVVDTATGAAEFGSGGGIVWDSDPDAEWRELGAKAGVLTAPLTGFDLVETLLGARNLDRHLERLGFSAARFGFIFDVEAARAAVLAAGSGRVRVRLERSGLLEVTTTSPPPEDERPVRLAVDEVPIDSTDLILFHKTTRREVYDVRRARHPEADDVLLVNERGEVTEATIANLAFRVEDQWWTPPLGAGCLPGVGREVLIENGTLKERSLPLSEIGRLEALALVSSLRGWRSAVLLPLR